MICSATVKRSCSKRSSSLAGPSGILQNTKLAQWSIHVRCCSCLRASLKRCASISSRSRSSVLVACENCGHCGSQDGRGDTGASCCAEQRQASVQLGRDGADISEVTKQCMHGGEHAGMYTNKFAGKNCMVLEVTARMPRRTSCIKISLASMPQRAESVRPASRLYVLYWCKSSRAF